MGRKSKAAYMISAVADRYEIHPQTLRLYEREGLLRPSRSDGNTRLYTDGDLERLAVILKLTCNLGVNLALVEIILNMRANHHAQPRIDESYASGGARGSILAGPGDNRADASSRASAEAAEAVRLRGGRSGDRLADSRRVQGERLSNAERGGMPKHSSPFGFALMNWTSGGGAAWRSQRARYRAGSSWTAPESSR